MHPDDLAGGFSDLEMTRLLYCVLAPPLHVNTSSSHMTLSNSNLHSDVVSFIQIYCVLVISRDELCVRVLILSGSASASKEPGHYEVRTSSSQVTRMHFFYTFFPQKVDDLFWSSSSKHKGRQRR